MDPTILLSKLQPLRKESCWSCYFLHLKFRTQYSASLKVDIKKIRGKSGKC